MRSRLVLLITGVLCAQFVHAQVCYRSADNFVKPDGGYDITGIITFVDSGSAKYLIFSQDFSTMAGPDLYVYLAEKNQSPTSGNNNFEIALLSTNTGYQVYTVPQGLGLNTFDYVLIHCRQYDHFWGGGMLGMSKGNCATGIVEKEKPVLKIAPNPMQNRASISWGNTDVDEIKVYNLNGQVVYKYRVFDGEKDHILNKSSLAPGIFIVSLIHQKGTLVRRKIAVQ